MLAPAGSLTGGSPRRRLTRERNGVSIIAFTLTDAESAEHSQRGGRRCDGRCGGAGAPAGAAVLTQCARHTERAAVPAGPLAVCGDTATGTRTLAVVASERQFWSTSELFWATSSRPLSPSRPRPKVAKMQLAPEPEPEPQDAGMTTLLVHTAYTAIDEHRHDLSVGDTLVLTAVCTNGWSEGFKIQDPDRRRLLFPSDFARPVQPSPRSLNSTSARSAPSSATHEVRARTPPMTSDDDDFDSVEEDEDPSEFHDASPTKIHLLHTTAIEELTLRHMAEKVELSAAYNQDLEQAVEGATEAVARAAAEHAAKAVAMEESHEAAVAEVRSSKTYGNRFTLILAY